MLLEREGLLETLGRHLVNASDGSGSLVLVAGEAGAGKTSLVRAFAESQDTSTLTIRGACDPLSTPRPLSPLYDFASDPVAGLSDLARGDLDPIDMFRLVLERLQNTIRPVVMVVEDIHWADEATLDFLRFIGRRVGDSKGTVICTFRDDEVGPDHPLRPVLGQLIPLDSTHRLSIPPLTVDAIATLAGDRPVDAPAVLRLTDGNAFFVTEVLETDDMLPPTVREAVLSRVARLDERPRRVVEAVSTAPRSLDVEEASTLVGATVDDTDQALAAGVLIGDGRSLRFRHELARSAVEDSMPPARRLQLHRRMLRLLEEKGSEDHARLAHHAMHAGEAELVIEYAPAAARDAAARGSHKEAREFFDAALRFHDRIDDRAEAEMRSEFANELGIIDRRAEAFQNVDRAVELLRELGDQQALASVLIPQTSARWRFENATRIRAELNEALGILVEEELTPECARAWLTSAYHYMLTRKAEAATREIARAKSTADQAGADELQWIIRMLEGAIYLVLGDSDQGVQILRELSAEAAEAGRGGDETLALMMLGSGGGEVRRYEEAIPALELAVDHGLLVDQDYLVSYCRAWLARIALEQGRWDDATDLAALVKRSSANQKSMGVLTGLTALGRVRTRRGDPGALELLDEMVELSHSHELQHAWNAICGRAELYWLEGEPEKGIYELERAYRRALDTDSAWARGEIGFWMWRLGEIEDPPEGAAEPFARQMRGEWRAAAESWRKIGCPYEVAMALADGPEAAKLEALEILDSLGARPLGDRIRGDLRDLGVAHIPRGPTRQTLANPGGLTQRQLEVLSLICLGMTNGEIAEELFVSKKTVEHHVSAVYAKLGVESRAHAVAKAVETGISDT